MKDEEENDEGFLHSLGKTIKSALYEEIPDDRSSEAPAARPSAFKPAPVVGDMESEQAALYKAVSEDLVKAGEGSLFYKFTDTVLSLQPIIADESSRYKAALAALKLDMPRVLKEQRSILSALDSQRAKTLGDLDTKDKVEIAAQEAEVKGLDQQIAELTARLQDMQKKRDALKTQITTGKQKLEVLKGRLGKAFGDLKQEIDMYGEKLQQYCK